MRLIQPNNTYLALFQTINYIRILDVDILNL